jgi:hypothetical protein
MTRQELEDIAFDALFGQFDGTKGIKLDHAGHDPNINIVQMIPNGDNVLLLEDITGDVNGDGAADAADASIMSVYLDQPASNFGYNVFTTMEGDWNGDQVVDSADFSILSTFLDQSYNPSNGPTIAGVSAVPEPASLGILAIGATSLLRRRRKA